MKRGIASLAGAALVASAFASLPLTASAEERGAPGPESSTAAASEAARADDGLGWGTEPQTYLVRFADEPAPAYTGGKKGFAPTAASERGTFDADDAATRAYTRQLAADQQDFVQRYEGEFGRELEVKFTYQYAVNGIAVVLEPAEARAMAKDPGVVDIRPDYERELHTDRGGQWIGATTTVNPYVPGMPGGETGEGVIVGVIDTGINPSSPSFSDTPVDGHVYINPLGEFVGVCDSSNTAQYDPDFPCNDKLIGAWAFVADLDTAVDYDGHGSHTASTAAGNVVHGLTIDVPSPPADTTFDIAGVAPHANVIAYLGCCTGSALAASVEQTIIDGVDVINYSIGSDSPTGDLYGEFDTIGFLNARKAGIFVATSNGNNGPGVATTGSPADAPWLTSVGASTHDRANVNALINLTSDGPVTLPDITGKSITGSLASTPMVYAGDFGNPLCLGPDDEGWVDNTLNFTGNIVVCDRGEIGRVQKSVNVADEGAVGFVHANDEANGDSLNGDAFAVPGVHISFDDGVVLKDWMAANTDPVGEIAGTTFDIDAAHGDHLAAFSSRGPNQVANIIVPDVTAPGVDILAAGGAGQTGSGTDYNLEDWEFISGTSMASPHVAGAGALLTEAQPDWTPAEMQSALMMTANPSVTDSDGTDSDPYDIGAGAINVAAASEAGFVMDEDDYLENFAGPGERDFSVINLPSFNQQQCVQLCSFERTGRSVAGAEVTWDVNIVDDSGLTLTTDAASYTVPAGGEFSFKVDANVAGAPIGETLFGRITMIPSDPSIPEVTMPVAVVPTTGRVPRGVEVDTRRDAASTVVSGIESLPTADLQASVSGLVPAEFEEFDLIEDPTNDWPFDGPFDGSNGEILFEYDVSAGATRFVTEILASESDDLDLFVGIDLNGDGVPTVNELVALSASGTAFEKVDLTDPGAGTYWVVVQNWSDAEPGPDAVTLATAIVGGDEGNTAVDVPAATVAGEPFDIRVGWDLADAAEGDRFYGTVTLGNNAANPDDIGSFPIVVNRHADDVAKTADVGTAETGDPVTYTVTVQPNVADHDIEYTVTDVIPGGMAYINGSATNSATAADGTVTWTGVLPVVPEGETGEPVSFSYQTAPEPGTEGEVVNVADHVTDDPHSQVVGSEAAVEVTDTTEEPVDPVDPVDPDDPIGTGAPTGDTVQVADGFDRVDTSIKLSQMGWSATEEVVLAYGWRYPDALAAQVLGAQLDAPVLLNPKDLLRDDVLAEIQRLESSVVYMMGGTAALSQEVEDALVAEGLEIVRLAGEDRAQTAALTAKKVAELTGAAPDQLILGLGWDKPDGGDGWVDVLAAGTLGTNARTPILLTGYSTLPQFTMDTIDELLPDDGTVWIVGGTSAVPQEIEDQVAAAGHSIERLWGVDRYETMAAVLSKAADFGAGLTPAVIASGRNFPDALAAGPVAWKLGGFLGLVDPNDLATSAATQTYLVDHAAEIDGAIVAGGSAAVSDGVVAQVKDAITE